MSSQQPLQSLTPRGTRERRERGGAGMGSGGSYTEMRMRPAEMLAYDTLAAQAYCAGDGATGT